MIVKLAAQNVFGLSRVALALAGVALAALGVLASAMPVIAVVIAGAMLVVGLLCRVSAERMATLTVMGVLILSATEQWISGLPFGPYMQYAVVMTDGLVVMLVLLLPGLLRGAVSGSARRLLPLVADPFIPAALLAIFAMLAVLAHPVPPFEALYWFRVNLRFVLAGVAVALLVLQQPELVRRFAVAVVALGVTQAVIGIVEFIGGRSVAKFFWPGGGVVGGVDTFATIGDRVVTGTFGHYNPLGVYLVLGISVVIGMRQIIDPSGMKRWPVMAAAVMAGTVILTESRQSIAGLVLAAAVVALSTRGRVRRVIVSIGVLSAITFSLLYGFGNPLAQDVVARFQELTTRRYWSIASQNRGFVLSTALPAALEYDPLLGVGPGAFQKSVVDREPVGALRLGYGPEAVKFVVDVGVAAVGIQVGLAGILALVAVFAAMISRALALMRSPAPTRGLGIAGLAVAAVVALTSFASSPLVFKPTSAVFWVVFGMVAARSAVERVTPVEPLC